MCEIAGGILLFFYSVPLGKIFVKLLRRLAFLDRKLVYGKMPRFMRKFFTSVSTYEYFLYPIRKILATPILWGFFIYQLVHFFYYKEPFHHDSFLMLFITGLFLVLNQWVKSEKDRVNVRMMEYLRVRPNLHPEEFFDRYRRQLALAFGGLDNHLDNEMVDPKDADFRKHEKSQFRRGIVFKAFWDTIQCADILLSVLNRVGPQYLYENADKMAAMAGKRILQLCQGALTVKGLEKLNGLKGKFIFVCNHESTLDFMISFFALSTVQINNRSARIRYLVAKDHFKDNFLVYRVMGIGKVIEAMDMIFLNRKHRKKSHQNLKEAAQAMVAKNVDLAIYPQGTRAPCAYDRTGKRKGAGYFTTLNKKNPHQINSHLKKGTAHLALDILLELNRQHKDEDLHLVFLGIQGASVILPKGQWKVETEIPVELQIGDVLKLPATMVDEIFPDGLKSEHASVYRRQFVKQLTAAIDKKLIEALDLYERLNKRFYMDLKGQFRHYDQEKMQQITNTLELAKSDNPQIFQILDLIYTLPSQHWNGYLSELCQLLLGRPNEKRLDDLLKDVTVKFLKCKVS